MKLSINDKSSLFASFYASSKAASWSISMSYEAALKSAKNYTQVDSKLGWQAGLKATENRFPQRGLVLANTTLFAGSDLRRFEPAWRPNFESTLVYIKNQNFGIKG